MSNNKSIVPVRRNKGGRKTKFTPTTVKRVLKCIEKGMPLCHAATGAGISYQSMLNYKGRHPDFAARLEQSISKGLDKTLEVIDNALDSQDESIRLRAACWRAEHIFPQWFSRSRVEIEAVGQFDHAFVIPRDTLDKIAQARAKLERESNGNGSLALPEPTP
jgi:hypothetical protein